MRTWIDSFDLVTNYLAPTLITTYLFTSNERQYVKQGDRIAQMVFEKFGRPQIEVTTTLPPTGRNRGGFGSTNRRRHPVIKLDHD